LGDWKNLPKFPSDADYGVRVTGGQREKEKSERDRRNRTRPSDLVFKVVREKQLGEPGKEPLNKRHDFTRSQNSTKKPTSKETTNLGQGEKKDSGNPTLLSSP